jgi:membrane-bound ClpP family serine protease
MPHFSNTAIIVLIAVGVFFIIAKLLKVEKGAALLGFGGIVLFLILHFTGYDEKLYKVIFQAPPVQHAQPEDLMKR